MAESSGAGDVSARKRRAVELARAGRIDEAAALLETLAGSRGGADEATREWAATQLEKLRPSRKAIDVAALCAAAEELFRKYDYEQAAALLLPIPPAQRTPESKKLLERSVRLRDEVAELTQDLKENLASRQFETLEADVKRLLQICPPSAFGKRLKTTLDTYRRIPVFRRQYRVDQNGQLLEAAPSRLIPGMVPGLAVLKSQTNLDLKQLTDEDVRVFAELPNVSTLDISYLWFTKAGVTSLAAMPHLEKLICSTTQISEQDAAALTQGRTLKIEVRKP